MAFFTLKLKLSINKCTQVRKYMSLADLTTTEILCNCICVYVYVRDPWMAHPFTVKGWLPRQHSHTTQTRSYE